MTQIRYRDFNETKQVFFSIRKQLGCYKKKLRHLDNVIKFGIDLALILGNSDNHAIDRATIFLRNPGQLIIPVIQ